MSLHASAPRMLATCLAFACGFIPPSRTSAEPTVVELQQLYESRRKQLTQLSVRWKGSNDLMARDGATYVDSETRAALKNNKRFYDRRLIPVAGPPADPQSVHTAMSFDEHETRILLFTSHARIWPGDKREEFGAPDEFLALQGYPTATFSIVVGAEKRLLSCDLPDLLSGGDYRIEGAIPGGDPAIIVLSAEDDRLSLDQRRNYALVRREINDTTTGQVLYRLTFDDWREIQPGFWLAMKIAWETLQQGAVTGRWNLTVLEWELNDVPDALFTLTLEPGTTVEDLRQRTAGADGITPVTSYQIPAKAEDLDAIIADAVRLGEERTIAVERGSSIRRIVLSVNIVIVLAGVSLFLYRKSRQRKTA